MLGSLMKKYIGPVGFFVFLIILWQVLIDVFNPPRILIVGPVPVLEFMVEQWPRMLDNSLITTQEIVIGFLVGVGLAVPIAIGIAYSVFFRVTMYPLVLAAKVMPKVAIAPLLFVWLGLGIAPKALLVALIAFFPVVVNAVLGLTSVDRELLELSRSLRASRVKTFFKISLPHSLPYIFAGLKVSIALAAVGAIVAEFVGGSFGLGFLIQEGLGIGRSVQMLAALLALIVIGLALLGSVLLAEHIAVPWARAQKSTMGEEGIA